MRPENIEIFKSLIINAFIGAAYYGACSRYSLLPKKILDSQISVFALSAIVYNPMHSIWDSERTLGASEIIPITLFILLKESECPWRIQAVSTVILAGSQIVTAKSLHQSHVHSSPKDRKEIQWLDNYDLIEYCNHLKQNYPDMNFPAPFTWSLEDLNTYIESANYPCFVPLHVTRNHWTLIYINQDKQTVEYYDSKQRYGNYDEITQKLEEIAKTLGFQFQSKIQKRLQPDVYQCGVWVLYFMEKLLENPDVDFNELNIDEAQTMIANFRKKVIPFFTHERWK